jgi:hemerythrin
MHLQRDLCADLGMLCMPIAWRIEMSVDGGMIDDDHRCLIDIINDVEAIQPGPAMPKEVTIALAELATYAETHFEREQQLQATVRFTYSRTHQLRHNALIRDLNAMRAEWEITRAPPQVKAFHAHLCDFLHHWLIDHICKADLLMKPFVEEMQRCTQGIAPLATAVQLREVAMSFR